MMKRFAFLFFLVIFTPAKPLFLYSAEPSGGVGVILEYLPDKRVHRVRAVFQGSPAAKAKVEAGDEIVAIDGNPTASMSFEDLGRRIRGNPGEPVTLTLRSPSSTTTREVRLTRVGTVSPLIIGAPGAGAPPGAIPSTLPSGTGRLIPQQTLTEEEKTQIKAVISRLQTPEERKKMQELLTELRDGKLIKSDFFQLLKVHFPAAYR
jgi:membrane-associated protease RseP (regulator of RpoE activity)